MSPNAQALRDAQIAEAPVLSALKGQQAQYDKQEAQRETNAQGFAEALGEMLKGVGPATQSAYSNAGGATAGFAKGFSDAEQHMAENEGASLQSFLDKAGIPQEAAAGALGKIGGTGDVLYGLSGYEPASNLEREGAAFTSAANALPAYAAGLGEQNVHQLQNAAATQDQQFEQQIANERGKIPSLANQLLQQMLNREQQQESIDIQKAYLGNSTRAAQETATGVDPVTGQAKPGYYVTKSGSVLPDGYVMKGGHPVRLSTRKGYNINDALSSAQPHIYTSAKDLVKTVKNTGPLAGLSGHPATIEQKPPFAKAAKELFNEYKYLLRQVPRSKQPSAKRLLNQTIREALAAAGIVPPKKVAQAPQPAGPGTNY